MNGRKAKALRRRERERLALEGQAQKRVSGLWWLALFLPLTILVYSVALFGGRDLTAKPKPSGNFSSSESPASSSAANNIGLSIDDEEITPATWRGLDLELRQEDGSVVEIGLLRPIWWLELAKAEVGGEIHL
ncbi:MAG: hypothetical protein AAFY88_00495, partial [Acidobacteriota bacterium]